MYVAEKSRWSYEMVEKAEPWFGDEALGEGGMQCSQCKVGLRRKLAGMVL